MPKRILVTGGGGYVGAVLIPKLLRAGYDVRVLDLFLFGKDVLDAVKNNYNLSLIKGDIRDLATLEEATRGCDVVIHLACISNDPSFELDPALGKSINYDCFPDMVAIAKRQNIGRFIYASSSSVYGVKSERNVTEELPLEPLTDYSKFKAMCEDVLLNEATSNFIPLVIRPATVCGYSPRQRLDLIVNILTNFAVNKGKIRVFGGDQLRPNIHIEDMTDLYLESLEWEDRIIDSQIFNAGYENHSIAGLANLVKKVVGDQIEIEVVPTDDNRSYHVSSEKLSQMTGFKTKKTIEGAVVDLTGAFNQGKLPNSFDDIRYSNIKTMQASNLK